MKEAPPPASPQPPPPPLSPELERLRSKEAEAAAAKSQGRLAASEELFRAVLAERARAQGPLHLDYFATKAALGGVLHARGRLEEAERLLRASLAGRKAALGASHALVLEQQLALGLLLQDAGRFGESEAECRAVLAAIVASSGPGGESREGALVAATMIAAAQQEQGDLRGAEHTLRRVVLLRREAFGDQHADTIAAVGRLASLLVAHAGVEPCASESLMAEAEGMYRSVGDALRDGDDFGDHPPRHAERAVAAANLGMLMDDREEYVESAEAFREALGLFRQAAGGAQWDGSSLAIALRLARALHRGGAAPEAEEAAWREAASGCAELLGERDVEALAARASLALSLKALRRFAEAEELIRATLAAQREVLGGKEVAQPLHADIVRSLEFLADILTASAEAGGPEGGVGPAKAEEAEGALREALAARKANGEEGSPPTAALLGLLVRLAALLDGGGIGRADEACAVRREHFIGSCRVNGVADAASGFAREAFRQALVKGGKRPSEAEQEVGAALTEAAANLAA